MDFHPRLEPTEIEIHFASDDALGLSSLLSLMGGFDNLLRSERDQHTKDNDPDLASELAPAV
jgi:hypothetical protein